MRRNPMIALHRSSALVSVIIGLTLLCMAGCGIDNEGLPPVSSHGTIIIETLVASLVDVDGNKITSVGTGEPVIVEITGLTANTQYYITVTDPNGDPLNPTEGFILTTDEDGYILSSTLVQNLNLRDYVTSKPFHQIEMIQAATPGLHTLKIFTANTDFTSNDDLVYALTFTVADSSRVYAVDSGGTAEMSFRSSDTVYARVDVVGSDISDDDYWVYVRSDQYSMLEDQESLQLLDKAQITIAGGTGTVSLGSFSTGAYDLIVDVNKDQNFDPGTDLITNRARFHSAFTVQAANAASAIITQICSDGSGNYRDVFDPDCDFAVNLFLGDRSVTNVRDVYGYVIPPMQSAVTHSMGARRYVVAHQDTWNQGNTLTDVSGGYEAEPVQIFTGSGSIGRLWPRENFTAGCYDVVIDVDRNGVFDAGTDFVDNIDNTGATTCGCRIADTSCNSRITITSPSASSSTVPYTAITFAGTVTDSPLSGSVVVSSDTLVNEFDLTISSGSFTSTLPLFYGYNYLTASFLYSGGVACSKTVKVRSSATATYNALFRVQLTWDGDTDMDLHLVEPGGSYENGGTISDSDDCNYGNCKVGLAGTGSNTIDWGSEGDDDDPKLDVDCISCGTGVENIWMNGISEDGNYTIYVDAFSGSETDVRVTVFIGKSIVGEVNCGAMSAETATDSCFVGTITWLGGDSGTGTFTADGSKASDF